MIGSLVFIVGVIIAQPPPVIPIQSVAKDAMGNVAKNRDVYVKDVILNAAVGGARIWEETHVVKTDNDGIYTIYVGKGTKVFAFNNISDIGGMDWGNGPYFFNIKVAIAPSIPAAWWIAADNYIDMGTQQLMSVPYAMYAGNATVNNVTTSIQPGPPNTFLITDSAGNVSWTTPQAAQQTVTTITNFNLNFSVRTGQNAIIPALTTAYADVEIPGVELGDPIVATATRDYTDWAVYSAFVFKAGTVRVRFANYTDVDVKVLGSEYKIVVIK
jgi:hypothetical protein